MCCKEKTKIESIKDEVGAYKNEAPTFLSYIVALKKKKQEYELNLWKKCSILRIIRMISEKDRRMHRMRHDNVLWEYKFLSSGKMKKLRVCYGDLCQEQGEYDVLFCSAYKGDYYPVWRTLIGGLWSEKRISVQELAKYPELDMRSMGCWLSKEIPGNFKRIGCVELIDPEKRLDKAYLTEITLKSTFSTMRFMLEQAAIRQIPVRSVALPILGTGNQGIELYYIAVPLIHQCIRALETIEGLEEITFFERNPFKAEELIQILKETVDAKNEAVPEVFISYCNAQSRIAYQMRDAVTRNGISCWMAPESIRAGSSYQEAIPLALTQVSLVALLLTPEAEASPWVPKEIGTAIGANKVILPYQLYDYKIGTKFQFLLQESQIHQGWKDKEFTEFVENIHGYLS